MTRVLAYHKPAGLVVTHDDELGRETVYDRLLPKLPPRSGARAGTPWAASTRRRPGKNREVRRMLLAIGSQVIRLQRMAIGGLALDLEEDRWRALTPAELEGALGWSAPGGERARRA